MVEELIPISFHKLMQSHAYTVIVLGTEKKKFAIYTEPQVGRNLQLYLAQESRPRPYTHDLLMLIFKGFHIKILQIVITHLEDTLYFARLFLEQETAEQKVILEIDARPSDCIALTLLLQVPLFCRKEIFERAIPVED
jgi:uncharacterized protein